MFRRQFFSSRSGFSVGVAVFAALVFLWPYAGRAMVTPTKIVLQTGDFMQVLEGDELTRIFNLSPAITFNRQHHAEITRRGVCLQAEWFCRGFFSRRLQEHFVISQVPRLNQIEFESLLQRLSESIQREPLNARLTVTDGQVRVTKDALPGRELNREATATRLRAALDQNILSHLTLELETVTHPAAVSAATLEELGIRELVSEGKTDFRGSPKNRIFNIKRALQQYDGALIAPGAEFSFVDLLGEVDGEHGYLPELVIKYNRTEPEFGGGICQVSTTMFRAALNAGLKITMRKNHAYPVQYYKPYGMDATIYIPRPDLRFLNNTPSYLLVMPSVVGTELIFSLYGTRDGRSVVLDGPHILERNPDGSMKTIFTQTVTDASGAVLINDSFPSSYKSPSLFPHPGEEPVYTEKPDGWSEKQWREYKKIRS